MCIVGIRASSVPPLQGLLFLKGALGTHQNSACLRSARPNRKKGPVLVDETRPLPTEPATWPIKIDLGSVRFLRVVHYTSQTEVNEGGWLIAIDGEPLPTVFLGGSDSVSAANGTLTGVEALQALRLALEVLDLPTRYSSVEELILDGWRPA